MLVYATSDPNNFMALSITLAISPPFRDSELHGLLMLHHQAHGFSLVGKVNFPIFCYCKTCIFNRPGVARAVLQSPPWLINSVTHPLVKISSKHSQSQTGRARVLKFWENVHPTLCVTCHVSCVTCHLSHVTCHMSPVTCHTSKKNK